jgi:ribonuclease G
MSPNTLVINCDLRETRVALIEDGVIAELQIERAAHRGTVGNIVLGRVSRVLPGMQAAFIDVGMERAAFLHVEDLIRPDDFESYLAGDYGELDKSDGGKEGRQTAEGGTAERADSGPAAGSAFIEESSPSASSGSDGDDDEDFDDDDDDLEDEDDEEGSDPTPEASSDVDAADDEDDDDEDEDDVDEEGEDDVDEDDDDFDEDDDEFDEEDEDDDAPEEEAGAAADEPPTASLEAEPGVPSPARIPVKRRIPAPKGEEEEEEDRSQAGRRRRRKRRGAKPEPARKRSENGRSRNGSGRENRPREAGASGGRPRENGRRQGRVSRDVPITDVVKEGDHVIVQISKEPIGTKGARVTSHVSLPGRYCVFLPTVDHVGISKRIGSPEERGRLRKVIEAMKPKSGGVIVRTVASGLTKKALKTDLGYLMRLWSDISKRVESTAKKQPTVLYSELDLVLKTVRDLFTDDIDKIVIDDKEQYRRLLRFIETFLPERVKDVELYAGDEPIFDAYGIEDEIRRALSRKVPLPSGGYLIIDQAEALTAIDVNTGRFVGKGSGSLEETALKTNLEAASEIAYQLRFRNVGGLVVLDLIDMEDRKNREKVYRALETALTKDKAKTTINRISDLGLIEMTRKRTRESLSRTMHEPCFYCDGTGHIQSRTTIAYEILRQLRRERDQLPGYTIVVNAHPAVVDLLQGEERETVKDAEARIMRRIRLAPHKEYHIEQFDLKGE